MGSRLDGLMQRYAIQAAAALSPTTIKDKAAAKLDAMKAGGLMSRTGQYLQPVDAGAAAYLQNLRTAAATGKMPTPAVARNLGTISFSGDWETSAAGGITGGEGGFAGPLASSLPQSGTPTSAIPGGQARRQRPWLGQAAPTGQPIPQNRYDAPPPPPPVSFTPSRAPGRASGRPTGLPRPKPR